MKAMVFFALGTKQLSASDILLECQCSEWDHNNWIDLRASATYASICATLDELVKDGLLQIIAPSGDPSDNAFGVLRYKRTIGANLTLTSKAINAGLVRKRCVGAQNRYGSQYMHEKS